MIEDFMNPPTRPSVVRLSFSLWRIKSGDSILNGDEGRKRDAHSIKLGSHSLPVNKDGAIRLPTLEEMEQMRANGQVIKQDLCSPESLAE